MTMMRELVGVMGEMTRMLLERMDKFNVVGEVAFVMHTRQLRALKARGRGLGGARIEDRIFGSARSCRAFSARSPS
jgi:hypothetical protein